ncbi:SDR family oxidoreductase [uncultured Chitinophaga sp.]|jgi:Short-chain dehydrogenases of various substrate specificities|uniref:SDR family NAD(P)-dependent oxidoreductase n=1 Tax=uncultured Chitinophaga sp. TaxID=339340 RepID=UPI0026260507|nr:SDR family oxidoreductase [uncultured Chitinophaga sp.]
MATVNQENRNKYAVITGATSGIGYELAKLFAADSYNLILVARSEERLQQVTDRLKQQYSVEITPIPRDLFIPGAAKEVYEQVKALNITVDVLVNDAGQGEWGPFVETTLERDIDIIQLNIISLLTLTKLFLQDMIVRNEGKILQVGSEAGTTPMPLLSVYAATKAFVISFSAALTEELRDKNITVTVLLPGATDTDFFHKAHQDQAVVYRDKELASPEDVAKDGYEALMKGESKVISGARTKMHVMMNDLLGARKSAVFGRKQNEPSTKEEGREVPSHEPSLEEREHIIAETGKKRGDL